MLTIKIESPKAFRLPDIQLSSDKLPIVLPSSRHDAKPFVGCSAFLSTMFFRLLGDFIGHYIDHNYKNKSKNVDLLQRQFDNDKKINKSKKKTKHKNKI